MWNVSPKKAAEVQKNLAKLVSEKREFGDIKTVAGVDVGIRKGRAKAAIALLDFKTLKTIEVGVAEGPVEFPYIPGLLTFREGPLVMKTIKKMRRRPDLLMFDGQGRAHPRRLGIASHLGLLMDIPSIGCAKTRLCGEFEEPGIEKGDMTLLNDRGEIIGAVLRTRKRVKPVFISVGHKIDLKSSVKFVLGCCIKYRLPETIRKAHKFAAFGNS